MENDAAYMALLRRVTDLELKMGEMRRRLANAERKRETSKEERALAKKYPGGANKTQAAEEMGVTRATVYQMIEDGRLAENGLGRITPESMAGLMAVGNGGRQKRKKAEPADGRRNKKERKENLV